MLGTVPAYDLLFSFGSCSHRKIALKVIALLERLSTSMLPSSILAKYHLSLENSFILF